MRLTKAEKYEMAVDRLRGYANNPYNSIVDNITKGDKIYAIDNDSNRYWIVEFTFSGFRLLSQFETLDGAKKALRLIEVL